jgi:hypothetical protein
MIKLPFAKKFKKCMELPEEGDLAEGFSIESIKVGHIGIHQGIYDYPTELIIKGKGGKLGVRKAFKPIFDKKSTTFSGYGNPYQCRGSKMEIERLIEGKYLIKVRGVCVRVFLKEELIKFAQYLSKNQYFNKKKDSFNPVVITENYLKDYNQLL